MALISEEVIGDSDQSPFYAEMGMKQESNRVANLLLGCRWGKKIERLGGNAKASERFSSKM